MVQSDFKIYEDWERKLRERKKENREKNGDKEEKCLQVLFLFFF